MSSQVAAGIMMAVCVAVAAVSQALVAMKSVDAMARQPEKAGQIQTAMILGLSLIEALVIYALIVALQMI